MATILVVDDHPVLVRVLSHMLRRSNHQVKTADGGRVALDILARNTIDLAIIDLSMPEMDGMTLLRHLRADSRYKELPVIMLTASGQEPDRLAARLEGADAFLTKPAHSWLLAETIARLLHSGEVLAAYPPAGKAVGVAATW